MTQFATYEKEANFQNISLRINEEHSNCLDIIVLVCVSREIAQDSVHVENIVRQTSFLAQNKQI